MKRWLATGLCLITLSLPLLGSAADTLPDTLGDGEYIGKRFNYYDQIIQGNTGLGGFDDVANTGPLLTASLVINFLLTLLGTIALCLTFYAGYVWMIARGNTEEVTRAQNILKGSVTGILIILASYMIMNTVFASFVELTN